MISNWLLIIIIYGASVTTIHTTEAQCMAMVDQQAGPHVLCVAPDGKVYDSRQ